MTNDQLMLSAAVLAGGQSSRMGQNKALLPLVANGPPMLNLVLKQLRPVADDLMIVANDPETYDHFDARVVPDLRPGSGALGGIQAALEHAVHDYCLVVACDMPFINVRLLQRLAREPRNYDVLAPKLPGESRQGGDGFVLQTLHAIYSRACAPAIAARLNQGDRRVVGFFDDVRLRTIDEAEIRRWDPDLHSFFNANTPVALEKAREMAETLEQ